MEQQNFNQQQDAGAQQQVAAQQPAKSGKGTIAGMVVFAFLAIAGVGFGVYGMTAGGNAKASDFTIKVTDKDGQVTTLNTDEVTISDKDKTITITDTPVISKNPVIMSNDDYTYSTNWSGMGGIYNIADQKNYGIELSIKDGEIYSCIMGETRYDNEFGGWNWTTTRAVVEQQKCTIDGFTGKISKIVDLAAGHASTGGAFAFILEDGTVYAFSYGDDDAIKTAATTRKFTTKKLDIDKFVTDAFVIGAGNGYSGAAATVFYYADGTFSVESDTLWNK